MRLESIKHDQQMIMNGIQDMVFIIDVKPGPSFHYSFLNIAAMKGTGLSEIIIGKSFHEVNAESKANLLEKKYSLTCREKKVTTYEDSFLSASNETLYSKTTLTPLFSKNNECTTIVAVVKDITTEKKAKQEADKSRKKLLESNQRYQSLYAYNLDAIVSVDFNGKILNGNAAASSITGYDIEEIQGKSYYEFVIQEDIPKVEEHFNEALNGNFQELHLAIKSKSGKEIKLMLKFNPIIINTEVTGVYSIFKDITEQEQTLDKLRQSDERFRIISEHGHILITLLDKNGIIKYVSPSYQDILGYNFEEYKEKLFLHNTHPEDRPKLNEQILQSIKQGKSCTLKFRQQHRTRGWIWTEISADPIFNDEGSFVQMMVLTRDITMQREYEKRLEYLAMYDSLTELPNRRYFNEHLEKMVKDFNQGESSAMISLFVLDIDRFKDINDNLGHDTGDAIIKKFAQKVHACLQQDQVITRLGGDEFAIIISDCKERNEVVMLAKRIVETLQEPLEIFDTSLRITTSIGIATAKTPTITEYCLYKQADLALYEAKKDGKNTFKLKEITEIKEG
ncbi:sensor domain-containing protein [Virgibacillus halodenitrificans]|uniref:sensor domain-containing protein n=1 Tax=Virgibacillus halodenitrificans TaxID=1482 RepID=UPI002DBC6494|nr:PAS domain S-box protein [Virgibacillus halodenitrificans]MEC2159321.1 PAS domain S-box protein [Virgibacillus halodenitrificans]